MRATDQVTLEDVTSHLSVKFALENVQGAGVEVSGGIALYRGALGRADVVHRVHAEGTEDFVVFEERPTRELVSYLVDVSRIAGLRLVSNTLEFMDESGTPQLRISPPYVVDAKGQSHEAKLAVDGCAYDTSPVGPWGRAVTRPGAQQCTVRVAWEAGLAYPILVDPAWGTTGSLATARQQHTASVLASGKVLIAGGHNNSAPLTSAELYDPAGNAGRGTFAATAAMAVARFDHGASVLLSGKVLVAGGYNTRSQASAELFDPNTGQFSSTGGMTTTRQLFTASLLPTGKVLVTGGLGASGGELQSAEVYDPAGNGGAGSFTATGAMARTRYRHTASVLRSGKVLVTGGQTTVGILATAELWDSATGTFVATGLMATPRSVHTASVLGSGKVLIAGGSSSTGNTEIYDPVAGTFAATGALTTGRFLPTASVLPSGKVLVAGGYNTGYLASAEMFDPAGNGGAGTFAAAGSMAVARYRYTASVLAMGKVLVVGGESVGGTLASAEVFGGAIGEVCVGNGACLSGFCADGVCCSSACSGGACDRCDLPGKQGTCSVAPQGNPGANPACVGYVCDGTSVTCPTSCTGDSSCGAEFYCAPDRTCQPRKALAAACNPQVNCKEPGCRECASGSCADGVCCDTACTGSCQACVAALKQNAVGDGTCGPIRGGTDPSNECAPSTTVCAADGQCDGAGACRTLTPASVSCGPEGKVCDGKGTCVVPTADTCDGANTVRKVDGTTFDCAPYKCNSNGTCRAECTSVSDCTGETICDSSGKCVASTPGPDTAGSEGGCSSSPSTPAGGAAFPLALLVSMAALARRRRRLQ